MSVDRIVLYQNNNGSTKSYIQISSHRISHDVVFDQISVNVYASVFPHFHFIFPYDKYDPSYLRTFLPLREHVSPTKFTRNFRKGSCLEIKDILLIHS